MTPRTDFLKHTKGQELEEKSGNIKLDDMLVGTSR